MIRGSRCALPLLRHMSTAPLKRQARRGAFLGTSIFVVSHDGTSDQHQGVFVGKRMLSSDSQPAALKVKDATPHKQPRKLFDRIRDTKAIALRRMSSGHSNNDYDPNAMKKMGWTLLGSAALVTLGALAYKGKKEGDEEKAEQKEQFMSKYVRARLRSVFGTVAYGLLFTTGVAALTHVTGLSTYILRLNPWVGLALFLPAQIGAACYILSNVDVQKRARIYYAFSASYGLMLAPLSFFGGPLVAAAAGTTLLLCGALSLVAAYAPHERFLWMKGPATIGLVATVVVAFGHFLMPASPALFALNVYGGLGVFGLLYMLKVMEVIKRAQSEETNQLHTLIGTEEDKVQQLLKQYDPYREALGIYLDILNIFIRILEIMAKAQGQSRRK